MGQVRGNGEIDNAQYLAHDGGLAGLLLKHLLERTSGRKQTVAHQDRLNTVADRR